MSNEPYSTLETSPPAASKGMKIAVSFVFVISLLSLAASALLYRLYDTQRVRLQSLEDSQVQIQELASGLNDEVVQSRATLDGLRKQLSQISESREEWKSRLEENQAGIERLTKSFDDLKTSGGSSLMASAAAAEPALSETAAQSPAPAASPKVPGVLTVNRKFNFVVINLGSQENVKIGDKFPVLRQDKKIGTVEVEKLYEKFSAATILEENSKTPIQEGDSLGSPS